ncbi:transcription initiation protein [Streptosporangiaceae bacterium NEAU-GS5]|nr:transcription initiation protein [Streptosporangiaceae bacterium NEAU-GS5]
MSRYLLLICVDPDIEVNSDANAIEVWLKEVSGARMYGNELRPPEEGQFVRVREGRVNVLTGDGPFAETKEFVAGFDVLECATIEEAVEIGSRHPAARFGTVYVRQFL